MKKESHSITIPIVAITYEKGPDGEYIFRGTEGWEEFFEVARGVDRRNMERTIPISLSLQFIKALWDVYGGGTEHHWLAGDVLEPALLTEVQGGNGRFPLYEFKGRETSGRVIIHERFFNEPSRVLIHVKYNEDST